MGYVLGDNGIRILVLEGEVGTDRGNRNGYVVVKHGR